MIRRPANWIDAIEHAFGLAGWEEIYSVNLIDTRYATIAMHGWIDCESLSDEDREAAEYTEVDGFVYAVREYHFDATRYDGLIQGDIEFPRSIPAELDATQAERDIVAELISESRLVCEVA